MGSKTSTTIQKSDPWGPSQPYIKDVMARSKAMFNGQNTLAPINNTLQQAQGRVLDVSQYNPELTGSAMGQIQNTINGDYMNSNPYLDAMYNQGAKKVSDSVNSNFSAAGRYGSGAHQGVLGETLGNMATDIYGSNYRTERQNQLNAAQLAPSMDSVYQGMLFNNANQALNIGNQIQDYKQQKQLEPWNRLNMYSGLINGYGGLGGNQSTTAPDGNRLAGAAGGALTGAAAGAKIGGSWLGIPGAGLGAIAGGIGGLF